MPIFVILQYLSLDMTLQCLDTLAKTFQGQAYHAVVVDNGSPNGSGIQLEDTLQGNPCCTVLRSAENLGFAKGNNLGYSYAAEHFDPEYIIVMNNDVLVQDPDFFQKIRAIEAETDFYVLGPDIYAPAADVHQSPMSASGYTLPQVKKIIRQRKSWLAVYPLHFWGSKAIQSGKTLVKKLLGRKPKPFNNPLSTAKRMENPVLHGACYIFSRKFLSVRSYAFDPATFLYFEEDILNFQCQQNGWKMIYDSSLTVTHLEDVSTNLAFRSEYRKRKMKYKNLVASASVLLNYMQTASKEQS